MLSSVEAVSAAPCPDDNRTPPRRNRGPLSSPPEHRERRSGTARQNIGNDDREHEPDEANRGNSRYLSIAPQHWCHRRCKLIEQIRRLVISSPTKPLAPMKAGVFDASQTLRPFEVRPTTTCHMHADNDCPTMTAGMTVGLSSPVASFGAHLPSLANEGRTARL